MIHTRLLGVLRLLNPTLPTDTTPRQAWEQIRPSKRPFVRNSFWWVLSNKLPFVKTDAGQTRIADYIFRQREAAQKAGRGWPPKAIEIKTAAKPQPKE